MKLPFPLALPRREDGSLLPAALAMVLAALLTLQLVLVDPVDLPEPVVRAGGAPVVRPFAAEPVVASPDIVRANVFSPERTAGSAPGGNAIGPLGGVIVGGSVSVGGRSYAMMIMPGGRIARLAVGGSINGWRLQRLSPDGARFVRGPEYFDITYGGQAQQATSSDEDAER